MIGSSSPPSESRRAPSISVEHLSHAFAEGTRRKEVLHDVSVNFYPREIAIIMGPSGCGKTTLLTLIGGLRPVQQGTVTLGGLRLGATAGTDLVAYRRRIGFVFQTHNLIASLSACQNVQLPLAFDPGATAASSQTRARELLGLVGIAHSADKRPRELSTGQQQRVAIARALVRKPAVILADEPTASLDRNSGREIIELLQHMAKHLNCSVVVVTHDSRVLDIADRILLLEDGVMRDAGDALGQIMGQLAALFALLPKYLDQWRASNVESTDTQKSALRSQFQTQAERLNHQAADLVHLNLPQAQAQQVDILLQFIVTLRSYEESLVRLGQFIIQAAAGSTSPLSLNLLEGLDTILLTTVDALSDSDPGQIEIWLKITGDRRPLMEHLRRQYLANASHESASGNGSDTLSKLTEGFADNVHLLNRLAQLWSALTHKSS
jgi:putative ABC transport system ATP-binding protein